eukprot:867788-Pelagomonas_calceolata.AAC.9
MQVQVVQVGKESSERVGEAREQLLVALEGGTQNINAYMNSTSKRMKLQGEGRLLHGFTICFVNGNRWQPNHDTHVPYNHKGLLPAPRHSAENSAHIGVEPPLRSHAPLRLWTAHGCERAGAHGRCCFTKRLYPHHKFEM